MGIHVHWYLPTNGDSRDSVGSGDRSQDTLSAITDFRAPTIDYLGQVARSAEQLGYEAVLTPTGTLWLSPTQAALLRALAEQPGRVLSRAELLRRVWVGISADEHAVEAAVARLRTALGPHAALVRTVPKRGYRLAVAG